MPQKDQPGQSKKDEHDYSICYIKQKIETPHLLPSGQHGISFSVTRLSHTCDKC